MSSLSYGLPFWRERFPKSRLPAYPRHRGRLETGVAIIGGGLTGCATAYVFAAAGVKVVLLERDRIGHGMGTVRSLGLLRQEPDADFQDVVRTHGVRVARRVWQETRRASLEFAATLRRLGVRCDLESQDAVWFARDREAERRLQRDLKARREAGVLQDGASWMSSAAFRRETAIAALGGIKARNVSQVDPYRALIGLARAAEARGALIFERSAADRVRAGRRHVEISVGGGMVTADLAVIATGYPPPDFRALRRHLSRSHTYIVQTDNLPAAVRREVGRRAVMLRDGDEPPHFLCWAPEDRVLFAGGDQPALPDRARPKGLVQRTGQLMYELSILYPAISGIPPVSGWDAEFSRTRDGLPLFGAHRNYPRHVFAFGHGRHGAGLAYLAARLLLRYHLGRPDRGDEWFSFARIL